jgi:hypothetical protein
MSAIYNVKNLGILQAPAGAPTRTYYIAAEPIMWDYAPLGFDGCSGQPWSEDQAVFAVTTNDTMGSRYKKARFVEYTDASFKTRKPQPREHGFLGPLLRAEVGDKVVVHFRNKLLFEASMQAFGGLAPLNNTTAYQVRCARPGVRAQRVGWSAAGALHACLQATHESGCARMSTNTRALRLLLRATMCVPSTGQHCHGQARCAVARVHRRAQAADHRCRGRGRGRDRAVCGEHLRAGRRAPRRRQDLHLVCARLGRPGVARRPRGRVRLRVWRGPHQAHQRRWARPGGARAGGVLCGCSCPCLRRPRDSQGTGHSRHSERSVVCRRVVCAAFLHPCPQAWLARWRCTARAG